MNIDVRALADLLQEENGSDSEDEAKTKKPSTLSAMGPGDVGPVRKSPNENRDAVKNKETKDIWDEEEIGDGAEYDDIYDTRQQPEYDIVYKQAVTSEDMFLGMSNKSPASASCENMVVKVILPDTKFSDVKLDVKDKFLDCRTPKYKLGLHLPHPVDSENGKAKWDGDKFLLTVTLTMKRQYDFMNF